MPPTSTPTDPDHPHSRAEADPMSVRKPTSEGEIGAVQPNPDRNAPVSFIPRTESGAIPSTPVRIRSVRYGELEEHELVRLLDSIEDERARGRFRESIYISLFIWMAVAWVVFYGPRYLWHAPKLVLPSEVLQQREMTRLDAPSLSAPAPRPSAPPRLDTRTLDHLREEARRAPSPAAPRPVERARPTEPERPSASVPLPAAPTPNLPQPAAPSTQPVERRPPPVEADAPTPHLAPTRPEFATNGSASDNIQRAIQGAARNPGSGGGAISGGSGAGGGLGTGVEVLSDMQGVNFDPYIRRILREIYNQWLPLIPEEARPPLSKSGTTLIRFTILPDGHIGFMGLDGSSHDDALNRAAWGSIPAVGQFPPLPAQFHGPNLELRIHYLVNDKGHE